MWPENDLLLLITYSTMAIVIRNVGKTHLDFISRLFYQNYPIQNNFLLASTSSFTLTY